MVNSELLCEIESELIVNSWNTICFANSIYYLFRDYTWNSPFVRAYPMNSGSVLRIHYEIIIFSMDSLWNHYLSCEFTLNSLPIRGDTVHSLLISWIQFLFREFTSFSRIHYQFRENTISQTSYEFFTYFTNLLWILMMFGE